MKSVIYAMFSHIWVFFRVVGVAIRRVGEVNQYLIRKTFD